MENLKFVAPCYFGNEERREFESNKKELEGEDLNLSVEELALKLLYAEMNLEKDNPNDCLGTFRGKLMACRPYILLKRVFVKEYGIYSAYLGTTVKGRGSNDFWISSVMEIVGSGDDVPKLTPFPCIAVSQSSKCSRAIGYKKLNELENTELREFGLKIWNDRFDYLNNALDNVNREYIVWRPSYRTA